MLQNLLSTEILVCEQINHSDAEHLIKSLEASELALQKFLAQEISFADYCEILELCGVTMDEYLINLESNLSIIGING